MAIEQWRPRGEMTKGPLGELTRMEREMESLFSRFFRDWAWPWDMTQRGAPAVDMIEGKDEVVLRADLPGLDQKDIEVSIDRGLLTIKGERKEEKEAKEGGVYCCERWAGTFTRTMALPPGVDPEKIQASFKNGVLEVRLPKTPEAQGKKIEIKAA